MTIHAVKKPKPPTLQGAPAFPNQGTWVRYTTDPTTGRLTGVWIYNGNEDSAIELPVSGIERDLPISGMGTYTITIPAPYVSEAK